MMASPLRRGCALILMLFTKVPLRLPMSVSTKRSPVHWIAA
jgi:hypothetical protein